MGKGTETEQRRHALRLLVRDRFDENIAAFARAIDRDDAYAWQLLNDGSFGKKIARHIERKLGLEAESLDRGAPVALSDDDYRGTPVVGTAQLGDDGYWHELQYPTGTGDGFVRYPARDPNTYALRVKGNSMRPRIKPGEFVVIEPNRPVVVGDEVMVQTVDGRSMVKQLSSRRDGMIELLSINEDHRPITLDEAEVAKIHYVGGILKASLYYEKAY